MVALPLMTRPNNRGRSGHVTWTRDALKDCERRPATEDNGETLDAAS